MNENIYQTLRKNYKLAFTLAEIMIVLTIIGILTAILLPIAINSAPDENVMKFKKGNNTLGTVIRELVNSDKYYANGDLGIRADGTLIDGTHDGDNTYFCETFADVVSTKSVNCKDEELTLTNLYWDIYNYSLELSQEHADMGCKNIANEIGPEIITSDGIIFYQTYPKQPFGYIYQNSRFYKDIKDDNGFNPIYKTFCMDIDGINKGEDPFGYGIRADGKILLGARAEEWLKKSIQKGE